MTGHLNERNDMRWRKACISTVIILGFSLFVFVVVLPVASLIVNVKSAQLDAIRAAERYAEPGVLDTDVVQVLGEPDDVFYRPTYFDHSVSGRILYYDFRFSVGLYVYISETGTVQCALVALG